MTICLTGYMGAGKTSVGAALAGLLRFGFIDLDARIEQDAGSSIAGIFSEHGEEGFRSREITALEGILQANGQNVVSLGGGSLLRDENRRNIERYRAILIYLAAPIEELWTRCTAERTAQQIDERPLLAMGEKAFRERFLVREPYYSAAAIRIQTMGKTVEQVAQECHTALSKSLLRTS